MGSAELAGHFPFRFVDGGNFQPAGVAYKFTDKFDGQ
jgi:hypothetical protein